MEKKKRLDHQLYDALLTLETPEECRAFLEDICTIKEVADMGLRLEAARLLQSGLTYEAVIKKTGISSTTLSRVSRCLHFGSGGYPKALARLADKKDNSLDHINQE